MHDNQGILSGAAMVEKAFGLQRAPKKEPLLLPSPAAAGRQIRPLRTWLVWLIFAAELLLILLAQLPETADFQKFGFYDQGAWLRLDELFAAGKVPTIDVGYSYGMLPLILGRAWFALFGRTPWAFIGFATTCNLVAVWGLARMLKAIGAQWWHVALACVILPYGIFPDNYSLMHPLEMMLIILALSEMARGKVGTALAFAALAVLAKPTMGYVLGFFLLIVGVWMWKRAGRWKIIAWPVAVGGIALAVEILFAGRRAVANNLLPLTGGRSYRAMHFGFFDAGREFWWPRWMKFDGLDNAWAAGEYYLLTPALFWLIASLTVWILGAMALIRLLRRKTGGAPSLSPDQSTTQPQLSAPRDREPSADASFRRNVLLATVAILHAVFVFAFYAWSGSWTYYSYLLVIGLLVGAVGMKRKWIIGGSLAGLALLGLTGKAFESIGRWHDMKRSADSDGLWAYPSFLEEAQKAREIAQDHHGLFLVNGALPLIWPDVHTPAIWFLSPGIPTHNELETIKKQIDDASAIILVTNYDQNQEAWNWKELADERAQFDEKPFWEGKEFRVLFRRNEH